MRSIAQRRSLRVMGLLALSTALVASALLLSHRANGVPSSPSLLSERIALGQQLFNDPHLSADGSIRCASCHIPEKGYTDGRRVAIGVFGKEGTRNTPSLAALSASQDHTFFWDGRRSALDQAVLDPLTNPVEMGLRDQADMLHRIAISSVYRNSFAHAFPETGANLTSQEVATALADYVRSLKQPESAYDRFALLGDTSALSPRAQMGLAIFKNQGRCADCHLLQGNPPMLTDHRYHRTGVGLDAISQNLPELTQCVIARSLQGADIGNRVATHADESQLGRFNATQNPADIGLFRTPSLRGVASTAPYMHDGSVATLDEAIDREVYYRSLQSGHPLQLTVKERAELKAFLLTL
jgi:cytochrome c peroxidase